MIQELMHDADQYSGWTMQITEGERAVGKIPFQFGDIRAFSG